MSAYPTNTPISSYRDRQLDGYTERERSRSRGRRQGERRDSSASPRARRPGSPQSPRRSRSPYSAKSWHDRDSRARFTGQPRGQDPNCNVAADPGAVILPPKRPGDGKRELLKANAHPPSTLSSEKMETRDPRILRRLNTAPTAGPPNSPGISSACSLDKSNCTSGLNAGRANDSPRCIPPQNSPSRQSGPRPPFQRARTATANTQNGDDVNPAITILKSLFEDVSTMAALKNDQSKIKAKVEYLTRRERKMGNEAKAFPAFTETNARERRVAESALKALEQQLSDHRSTQADTLASVPEMIYASRPCDAISKEQEQLESVQRCISSYEDFKVSLDGLNTTFKEHKRASAQLVQDSNAKLDSDILSARQEMQTIAPQLERLRIECNETNKAHSQLIHDLTLRASEIESSTAIMKSSIDQRGKEKEEEWIKLNSTNDEAMRRLKLLEASSEITKESASLDAGRLNRLEELTTTQQNEIKELKIAIFNAERSKDSVASENNLHEGSRQSIIDANGTAQAPGAEAQELTKLRSDMAILRTEFHELKKSHGSAQAAKSSNHIPLSTGIDPRIPSSSKMSSEDRNEYLDIKHRVESFFQRSQENLERKQKDEDKRDEIVIAQLEEFKAMLSKNAAAQNLVERRIHSLESELQKFRPDEMIRDLKQQMVSQSPGIQNPQSTTRTSSLSGPPTPQIYQVRQSPTNNIPSVPMIALPPDVHPRLNRAETSLLSLHQQVRPLIVACQQLNHRYNNLSTEFVVRGMVRQMQVLYPYASDTQREISELKQNFLSLKDIPLIVESLRRLVDDNNVNLTAASAYQPRFDALEREIKKLVEHIREERGKRKEGVNSQTSIFREIDKRVSQLEEIGKEERDQVQDSTGQVVGTVTESRKEGCTVATTKSLSKKAGDQYTRLLKNFKAGNDIGRNGHRFSEPQIEESDNAEAPSVTTANGVKSKSSPSSAPPELEKSLLEVKRSSRLKKKRKLRNDIEDSSDEDSSYSPTVKSSPPRRKTRVT